MNENILSGLLNLFALFGALNKIDKALALRVLTNYLSRHLGVRSLDTYLGLYSDLRNFYEDFPDFDKDVIIEEICSKLQHKIDREEQAFMLLRFMEFCNLSPTSSEGDKIQSQTPIFKKVAALFNISDELYEDFNHFISGTESKNILIFEHKGIIGTLRVLHLPIFNKLIFSYYGSDEVFLNDLPILPKISLLWQRSGVVKGKNTLPLYYSNIISRFENMGEDKFIELAGRDINFRFPKSDNGIHDLSFTLHSGQLVAIMGGSGVGKSTLLSLLNGNLKPQSGTITINGFDITSEKVKDLIGYVPQDDLLIEELTVFRNLWFTAKLCFDNLSDNEINKKVTSILSDLGLEGSMNLKAGSPVNKYISGGERKRLNIALELIREPAILFIDEPTSGLSSTDSEKVINLLKEQTYKGKLIVVNIHQPSSDIFKLFDRLWVLDKGGYPIYDGNPIEAITYFKQAAGYADSQISMCPSCGNINPEIILNIINDKVLNDSGSITEQRKVTTKQWHELYLNSISEDSASKKFEIPHSTQKRPNRLRQFSIFLNRNVLSKITNRQYLLISLLEAPILAVIVAFLTKYSPLGVYTVMDNKNLVSYMFMAIIVSVFMGMSSSAEEIIKDRAILKRERFLRLSQASYLWSKICFVAVLSLIQTFLFVIVGNTILQIESLFWVWYLILFLSSFLANIIGLLLSKTLNSVVAIYITIPLLLIPQILLCGLVVNFDDLSQKSKTGNVPIIGDIIPSRWAFEALAVTNFTSNDYEKLFFEKEKKKYSARYYNTVYLYELESQLERAQSEFADSSKPNESHFAIIRNELPRLASICNLRQYGNIQSITPDNYSIKMYQSLSDYFNKADSILQERFNLYNLSLDKDITSLIRNNSGKWVIELKKANYNLHLESLVLNSNSQEMFRIVDNTIVPKVGFVYLDPISNNGRAPFYSSSKIVCGKKINTLVFNVLVLILMSGFFIFFLFINTQKHNNIKKYLFLKNFKNKHL